MTPTPETPAENVFDLIQAKAKEIVVFHMASVFGWQHLVRFSGKSREWLDLTLLTIVRSAVAAERERANTATAETCPSPCVERSHPGREHDPATDGCYCWELCEMGPTCPGANAGLDRGCWRTQPLGEVERLVRVFDLLRERHQVDVMQSDLLACTCGERLPIVYGDDGHPLYNPAIRHHHEQYARAALDTPREDQP